MGREPVAEGWRAIRSGEDKVNRLQCPAGRTDFVKPRTPRKIVGAGHRCGGRRHQPAATGNEAADRQSLWHIFLCDIDPYDGGDRKSVVWGKSVAVRVDLGGRRIIKKKKIVK